MRIPRRGRSQHVVKLACLCILIAFAATAGLTPATAASPNLHTYFASDFTDAAYQAKVHKKVGTLWKRPEETPKPDSKAVVVATILRDGSLLEARLHLSSGLEAWDKSALATILKAAPFDPLPRAYTRTSVEVHFHFEYNK